MYGFRENQKDTYDSHRRLCLMRCPVRGIAFVHRFRVSGTLMRCAPYCGAPYGVSPAVHLRCIALHYVFSKNQLLFLTCPYHTLSPNTCIVKNEYNKKESCAQRIFIHATASLFIRISIPLSLDNFFDCSKQLIVSLVCRNIRILSLDRIGTLK